ncbi:MAG: SpoIIE family protein phosphatase, partial [Bacteroidia bacterium]|nr:SpoIIE family protein phosphatase [Bacteroidia bacterium]
MKREQVYLWYIGWIVTHAIYLIFVIEGYFPHLTGKLGFSIFYLGAYSIISLLTLGFGLTYHFLKIKTLLPKPLYYFNWSLLLLPLTLLICTHANIPHITARLFNIAVAIFSIFPILFSTLAIRKGNFSAVYFLVGFSSFAVFTILFILKNNGILPANFLTLNGYKIGVTLEMIILSLGIADRIKRLQNEKEIAQQQALQQALENERLVREQNVILEEKVKERTQELEHANEELNSINEELNATLELVKEQSREIEEKNKDITDSILYAKRIQEALLPTTESIKSFLPESFIFYQPREIVSGDFYWFEVIGPGVAILAAADCTGHGVPGAFMSMLGHELLNEIIKQRKIESPEQILQELHIGVRVALKQAESDNRDGMDITLCKIDLNQQQVSFAGAQNP